MNLNLPNGQSAKSGLNKSILDVSWGKFIDTLTYKASWNDKSIVHIDRFFHQVKHVVNVVGSIIL